MDGLDAVLNNPVLANRWSSHAVQSSATLRLCVIELIHADARDWTRDSQECSAAVAQLECAPPRLEERDPWALQAATALFAPGRFAPVGIGWSVGWLVGLLVGCTGIGTGSMVDTPGGTGWDRDWGRGCMGPGLAPAALHRLASVALVARTGTRGHTRAGRGHGRTGRLHSLCAAWL